MERSDQNPSREHHCWSRHPGTSGAVPSHARAARRCRRPSAAATRRSPGKLHILGLEGAKPSSNARLQTPGSAMLIRHHAEQSGNRIGTGGPGSASKSEHTIRQPGANVRRACRSRLGATAATGGSPGAISGGCGPGSRPPARLAQERRHDVCQRVHGALPEEGLHRGPLEEGALAMVREARGRMHALVLTRLRHHVALLQILPVGQSQTAIKRRRLMVISYATLDRTC